MYRMPLTRITAWKTSFLKKIAAPVTIPRSGKKCLSSTTMILASHLTGMHTEVECESCHVTKESPGGDLYVQYIELDFATCASCHDDEHDGAFGFNCDSCHKTEGWHQVADLENLGFDHSTTGYDLTGSHNTLACNSCHGKPAREDSEIAITFVLTTRTNSYPIIPVENCASCHVDYHEGVFEANWSAGSCEQCHGEHAWYPHHLILLSTTNDRRSN